MGGVANWWISTFSRTSANEALCGGRRATLAHHATRHGTLWRFLARTLRTVFLAFRPPPSLLLSPTRLLLRSARLTRHVHRLPDGRDSRAIPLCYRTDSHRDDNTLYRRTPRTHTCILRERPWSVHTRTYVPRANRVSKSTVRSQNFCHPRTESVSRASSLAVENARDAACHLVAWHLRNRHVHLSLLVVRSAHTVHVIFGRSVIARLSVGNGQKRIRGPSANEHGRHVQERHQRGLPAGGLCIFAR